MPDSPLKNERTPAWLRALPLAALSFAVMAVPWIGIAAAAWFLPPILPAWRALGWVTFLPFVAVAGLLVGFALAPTHLTSVLSGYLFGTVGGALAALGTIALGSAIGYQAARRLASDRLRDILEGSRWGRVLVGEMIDASPSRAAIAVALARLPPQVPFAVGNLLGASARIPLGSLLAGTVLGMVPRASLAALVGSQLADWQPGAPLPAGLAWAIVATVVGFGSLTVWGAAILRRKETG